MTRQQNLAWDIAERAEADEVQMQRMLGASWTDAYARAFKIGTEVYVLAVTPARSIQLEPLRYIKGRVA
jgi:hypothetical protein